MELRHLRYFVAIAEARSISRAAERLWVAQPGLSAQIRRLEVEIGVQLFVRHTRGVDLTAAGEVFLQRARHTLSAAEAASATGRDLAAGTIGRVTVGLTAGPRWMPASAALDQFTRERETVELDVIEGYGGALWHALREGRVDALIAPAAFASSDLGHLKLGGEPWVALMGRSHHLAAGGPLDACELQGESIAVTGHRDGAGHDRAVAELLDRLGVHVEVTRMPPGPALQDAVARGVAIVLTTAPEALHPQVTVRPLQPRVLLEFVLLWREQPAPPALGAFIETVSAHARRAPARPASASTAAGMLPD